MSRTAVNAGLDRMSFEWKTEALCAAYGHLDQFTPAN